MSMVEGVERMVCWCRNWLGVASGAVTGYSATGRHVSWAFKITRLNEQHLCRETRYVGQVDQNYEQG